MSQGESVYPLETKDGKPLDSTDGPAKRSDKGLVTKSLDAQTHELLFLILQELQEIKDKL